MSACLTRSVGLELRRTMSSADISSNKWIPTTGNGLKKVASLDRLCKENTESTWMPIQVESKEKEVSLQSSDIWSSILSQKKTDEEEGKNAPPPYIHPLVKRSASTLSEKSLEICTESLGSETGSDGFDKIESVVDAKESAITEMEDVVDEVVVSSFVMSPVMPAQQSLKKVTSVRCFPPPLAHRGDGSNVQMRSHREDGRLVLQAVSVPTHSCFKAERQDGRLLLSFFSPASETEEEDDVDEDEYQKVGDVVEDEDNQEIDSNSDSESEYEEVIMMNQDEFVERVGATKFLDLTRSFPRRLNRVVKSIDDEEEEEEEDDLLNNYVYGWRTKVGTGVVAKLKEEKVLEVVVDAKNGGKGGEDDLIPMFLKGCNLQQKHPKLVMWDHRCIAT